MYASGVNVESAVESLEFYAQNRFNIVELDVFPAIDYAIRLAMKHGLRAADSIQLASALIAHKTAGETPYMFVSCDRELNNAAQVEGLTVLNPDLQA